MSIYSYPHPDSLSDQDVAQLDHNLDQLPAICGARGIDGSPIVITRNAAGFMAAPAWFYPEGYNDQRAITRQQVAAMFAGSMFGWHTPAADPGSYDRAGLPKGARHDK